MAIRVNSVSAFTTRSFAGRTGGAEHYITVEPADDGDFASQLESVTRRYADAARARGLSPESAIFRRILVSDVLNQAEAVNASPLVDDPAAGPVAVSLVQQPPLPGHKIALLAYHVDGDASIAKRLLSPQHMVVEKAGRRHLWSTGLRSCRTEPGVSSFDETTVVFRQLTEALVGQGGTLAADCVRTWLFVKGVDVFYQDVVDSRIAFFDRHGLTRDSHYIASTGIEGAGGQRYEVVTMDAYSVLGLLPEQISYLNDFDLMCATHDYNVTFERGTRVAYADRAHHFISGTASIDHRGEVVHRGQVLRQLGRALENVEGLLRSGGATLADMMHLTVYLRELDRFRPGARLPARALRRPAHAGGAGAGVSPGLAGRDRGDRGGGECGTVAAGVLARFSKKKVCSFFKNRTKKLLLYLRGGGIHPLGVSPTLPPRPGPSHLPGAVPPAPPEVDCSTSNRCCDGEESTGRPFACSKLAIAPRVLVSRTPSAPPCR